MSIEDTPQFQGLLGEIRNSGRVPKQRVEAVKSSIECKDLKQMEMSWDINMSKMIIISNALSVFRSSGMEAQLSCDDCVKEMTELLEEVQGFIINKMAELEQEKRT